MFQAARKIEKEEGLEMQLVVRRVTAHVTQSRRTRTGDAFLCAAAIQTCSHDVYVSKPLKKKEANERPYLGELANMGAHMDKARR